MASIPGKQLHRVGTIEELQAYLSNREIGLCTTDNLAYYKLNDVLFPMGSGIIPDPAENGLLMSYADPDHPEEYAYGWRPFTETPAPYDEQLKLLSQIDGKGLYATVAENDMQGRNIASTLDNKINATDMTPGTYTKVSVNGQGAVTDGGDLEASDLPAHEHSAEDITSGTLDPDRIGEGSVPIEKLEMHKRLYVDGTTLTATESQDSVVLCVKTGGVGSGQLSPGFMFNKDPNYATNYANPHNSTDLNDYTNSYCDGQSANVVFLNNGSSAFELNNGFMAGNVKRYVEGDYVLITNKSQSSSLGIRTAGGSSDIKTIPAGSSSLFVCQYSGNATLTDNSVWVPVS